MDRRRSTVTEDESRRYQRYVRGIHLWSKRRRAAGTILTIVALLPVPVAPLLSYPRWIGLVIAGILVVLGKWLARWAAVLAGEADAILRANESRNAFGWPINKKMIADIREKYPALDKPLPKSWGKDYYAAGRKDKLTTRPGEIAIGMFMESSWWTERLARKTAVVGCWALVLVAIISFSMVVLSWLVGTSVGDGVGMLFVSVIISSDLVVRQRQYVELQRSSEVAGSRIRVIMEKSQDIGEGELITAVHDYMIARSGGPPIPELIYRLYERRLTKLWNEEFGDGW